MKGDIDQLPIQLNLVKSDNDYWSEPPPPHSTPPTTHF